jgi:NADH-quinone oxidoreductase subunit M
MPVFSSFFMIVTLSSIALPLLNGFVGEFLILLGTFNSTLLPRARLFASLAALGMILSAVYMLWMYQRVVFGEVRNSSNQKLADLSVREKLVLIPFAALALAMGVYPSLFLSRSAQTIQSIKARISSPAEIASQAVRPTSGIEER